MMKDFLAPPRFSCSPRQGAARRACLLMGVVLSIGLSSMEVSGEGTREQQFMWSEATARIETARTEADFLGAARVYGELVRDGVRNGPLFYNLGIALLQAHKYDEALRAFVRAERYLGSNPEIRRNILLARMQGSTDKVPRLPWYRYLLFWHYGLAAETRLSIAVISFATFWIALILRRFSQVRISRIALLLSLCAVVLYGSSTAATFLQENREETRALIQSERGPIS